MQVAKNDVPQYKTSPRLKGLLYEGKKRSLRRKPAKDWKICFMQIAKNDVPQ